MLDNIGSSRPQAPGQAGKEEVRPNNRGEETKTREMGPETREKPPNSVIRVSLPDFSQRERKGLNHGGGD